MQRFTTEHLDELVMDKERDGDVATAKVNAAAAALVEAFQERERIAADLSALASTVARVHPGDVSYSHAQNAVHAASELIEQGGGVPPTLRHDPRQPRHAAAAPVTA